VARLPWLGEWATPEIVAGRLRPLFLRTVSHVAPGVLEGLRDQVLPIHQRAWQDFEREVPPVPPTVLEQTKQVWPELKREPLEPGVVPTALHSLGYEVPADTRSLPTEGSTFRLTHYEDDPAVGRPLYTEEEAGELHARGYALLPDLHARGPERYYLWHDPLSASGAETQPTHHPQLEFSQLSWFSSLAPVGAALVDWAEGFHLQAPWVLNAALEQLYRWERRWYQAHPFWRWPADHESRDLAPPAYLRWSALPGMAWWSPIPQDDLRLSFAHPGWDPAMGLRAPAKARILADFARFLDDYLERMEERLRKDWEHAQQAPEYRALREHMEWLVLYQCGGLSFAKIAVQESYTRQAVGGAVQELAEFIGLDLRSPRPGRPRGAKDRAPRHRARA
jgi:hypothetical protein